ncbi:MAG: hypothetical protein KF691_07245 [Phycisphaeraceae bacterium]|nr:hypothetical protein [Phycisphaeraceae bacterium]
MPDTSPIDSVAPLPGVHRSFPCARCGADLSFSPGDSALKCGHCGTINPIPAPVTQVEENDYLSVLNDLEHNAETIERLEVRCDGCGANVEFPENVTSRACPFCGSPIVAQAVSKKLLKPTAILPFSVTRQAAIQHYRAWLKSRWFAPTKLAREAFLDGAFVGAYMPFWTYDCVATTDYTGQRGEDYWVTETYTTTVNGKLVTQTRQVRRTRWYPASGTVVDDFDDVLVPASNSLPLNSQVEAEPWGLKDLVPYDDAYLAGFRSESYRTDLQGGFEAAKQRMRSTIEGTICADIGGDHQRIISMRSAYDRIHFKHILLPMWLSAYRFNRKLYRVLINGRTGELIGDRPYSRWKIGSLIVILLVVAGIIALIAAYH